MPELLTRILSHVDAPEPLFDELTLCRWAQTPWSQFPARQFFRPAENATTVWCPSCVDAHSEEVVLRKDLVAKYELGEPCYASPAISDGQVFLRGFKHMYCIGQRNGP